MKRLTEILESIIQESPNTDMVRALKKGDWQKAQKIWVGTKPSDFRDENNQPLEKDDWVKLGKALKGTEIGTAKKILGIDAKWKSAAPGSPLNAPSAETGQSPLTVEEILKQVADYFYTNISFLVAEKAITRKAGAYVILVCPNSSFQHIQAGLEKVGLKPGATGGSLPGLIGQDGYVAVADWSRDPNTNAIIMKNLGSHRVTTHAGGKSLTALRVIVVPFDTGMSPQDSANLLDKKFKFTSSQPGYQTTTFPTP